MKSKLAILLLLATLLLVLSGCATLKTPAVSAQGAAQNVVPTPDYADVTPPAYPQHQTYDPRLPPATRDAVKEITLHVKDVTIDIAPDVPVDLWTFEGTAPGPALHVNQGDTVKFTLINDGQI